MYVPNFSPTHAREVVDFTTNYMYSQHVLKMDRKSACQATIVQYSTAVQLRSSLEMCLHVFIAYKRIPEAVNSCNFMETSF